MLNFGPTFIWIIINTAFLFLILKKMFFKPVIQFMENRRRSIIDSLDNAQRKMDEAELFNDMYSRQLAGAKDEALEILAESRAKAGKEYDSIISEARKESEAILARAREQIESERAQMMKEVRSYVSGLALAAASKVIEANMDTASNKAIVDKFIDEAGAA